MYNHNLYNTALYNGDSSTDVNAFSIRTQATIGCQGNMLIVNTTAARISSTITCTATVLRVQSVSMSSQASIFCKGVVLVPVSPSNRSSATMRCTAQVKIVVILASRSQANTSCVSAMTIKAHSQEVVTAQITSELLQRTLPAPASGNIRVLRGPRPTASK